MSLYRQLSVAVALLTFSLTGMAAELQVEHAWIREAPPNAKMLAGYFTLTNHGKKDKILVGASSSAFEKVEMHQTMEKNKMAHMQQQSKLTLSAGKSLEFKPGGLHLMLIHPLNPIKAGQSHEIHLKFSDQSEMTVNFKVTKHSGDTPQQHMHDNAMHEHNEMKHQHDH